MREIILVLGFLLTTLSIISSVFFHYPYWYSFYVIGAFLFFGSMNHARKSHTVFSYLMERKFRKFLIVYVFGVGMGLFVDVIYGRHIARLWYYPNLSGIWNFAIPIFIYYPFGGLQVYEIFYFIKSFLSKSISSKNSFMIPKKIKMYLSILLVLFMILGLILPVINLLWNNNYGANELMVVIMALTIFSGDALVYLFHGNSILFEALEGNKLIIGTMIGAWIITTLLTEVPNTFSWEWIYYNIPFTTSEILKINVVIFTMGWFFLVFAPVRFIDFVRLIFRLDDRVREKYNRGIPSGCGIS